MGGRLRRAVVGLLLAWGWSPWTQACDAVAGAGQDASLAGVGSGGVGSGAVAAAASGAMEGSSPSADVVDAADVADLVSAVDASATGAEPSSAMGMQSEAATLVGSFLPLADPLAKLPRGDALRTRVCSRGLQDPIALLFCQVPAPVPGSLTELLALLKLTPSADSLVHAFGFTAHSTSLSKRFVSAVNPRVIFTRHGGDEGPALALAFARGEHFVEALAQDPVSGELEFYLLAFSLPCEERSDRGCTPADRLTEAGERGWLAMDVFHEDDLVNTSLDCHVCHQAGGPATRKTPLMQELENTWTHWLFNYSAGGRVLTDDFLAAHGGSRYGGVPAALLDASRPARISDFARTLGPFRPDNMFASGLIESEVEQSAPGQPLDNSVPGQSATWRGLFEVAQRGEAIPVPYHDVKVTDGGKLATMTAAYQAYRAGDLAAPDLPDIRDVFPDDPARQVEMGFVVDDSLPDHELLTAACAMCHNPRLDQRLSRARFHLDLGRLSREQKDRAIERLRLPVTDAAAMPPRRIHDLTPAGRRRLIELLKK